MFFNWWKKWRRDKLLLQPMPATWHAILEHNVFSFAELTEADRTCVIDYLKVFLAEKKWEACAGFTITEEVRVTIAAQVAILVLGLEEVEYFERVTSILVYPEVYVAQGKVQLGSGVVMEGHSAREGEAWYRGPVVLSWPEVLAGGRHESGGNLVYHEFAHQLDMLNGSVVDGVPPLASTPQYERWSTVMNQHYQTHLQAYRQGHHTFLDSYGATNIGEFFAVATESFFMRPIAFQQHYPELYAIFREYYRQDTAPRRLAYQQERAGE